MITMRYVVKPFGRRGLHIILSTKTFKDGDIVIVTKEKEHIKPVPVPRLLTDEEALELLK